MEDSQMADAGESNVNQSQVQLLRQEELDQKYPHRPRNHSDTLPFHDLYLTLFNPLNENRKKPTGPATARRKQGPHGPSSHNPHEVRQKIIERFISRWRKEVGNDIYPAFRLIIPEKDRERPMYGLKEKIIGKLLIKVMKINKDSEDGYNLIHWKQPGQTTVSRMAGEFAGRCHEVISKRPMRVQAGNMTIGEVNDQLDKLAAAPKEDGQQAIFAEFYNRMNADELMWLIRIILRQMKVGATEKTFFSIWHPDADGLFGVSSNLRRICWELYDPNLRLEGDERGITLMQCFQPQLAQFQMHSFQKMIDKMRPSEDDPVFWIEEKLDGERMQLHMISDDEIPGGKKFGFWSRKAKDYTYLYGNGLMDENSALTRHLKNAFHEGVENIVLDGEMITWDLDLDAMVPFGTLKTAALEQQKNQYSKGRPLYRIFDIVYLNGVALTGYALRDRRRALEGAISNVHRRMEIHTYKEAQTADEIEPLLRQVVAEASEGLVLKNPRSAYRLNDRNDDWMKVKPEYMTEFGENLDCVIIGAYYGSGHRGGKLSSFLCGLRVDENHVRQGANPMKFYSFFKVGGGLTSADYAAIRHQTDGKWTKWDPKHPPTEYVALGGDHLQYERPDEWIMPSDSVVIEVKAASIAMTDQFKMNFTLRFPRFKKLRSDRNWENALSISGFLALKENVEKEAKGKQFKIDDSRRKRQKAFRKKALTVAGSEQILDTAYGEKATDVFGGFNFYIMTSSQKPEKRSKVELEQMTKANGGSIIQKCDNPDTICIADNRTVHVASTIKRGATDIVRPSWLFDNIKQSQTDKGRPSLLLPPEPRHLLFMTTETESIVEKSIDRHGDSFARDTSSHELEELFASMPSKFEHRVNVSQFKSELAMHHHDLGELPCWIFEGLLIHIDSEQTSNRSSLTVVPAPGLRMTQACNSARFAGASMTDVLVDGTTHVVVNDDDRSRHRSLREKTSTFTRLPRIVTVSWIEQSWLEKTLLDEERFAPV